MLDEITQLRQRAEKELEAAGSPAALDEWQARYLSRKGEVKLLLKSIGRISDPEAKKAVGREVNLLSRDLEERLEARRAGIREEERARRLEAEKIDISLPSARVARGRLHPVNRVLREICAIFQGMGFQIFESPHVETDEYNFQLLNFPKHHPAREMQDSFFISEDLLLRTHTSPGQIHAMRACAPEPLRALLPGTCYRNEAITPRSEIQFHQIEGLAVGPGVSLADLKGVLTEFVHQFFGPDRKVLMRGSYFPFTEPSVEVDVECILCGGAGCRLCKGSGWLEILGAGSVHPTVLRNGGYDPEEFTGFAFGLGIERIVMLRHAIDDIRHFFSGDLRFLEQFA
ncbi:MAG: phenylalanine--tRNA ligase subunit alpha [Planctomycetes bacterium]|nr:phenylalanine--tRNA ligase subunit alpha [Planctomycetota bacterium]